MPRAFSVAAFLQQLCKHPSPGTLAPKPTVTLGFTLLSPIWDSSSCPGKHVHQPSARRPAALGAQAQEFTGFLPSENMGLRNASCHLDIHPVANAESRGESLWDLPQAMTCYCAACRERRAVSCKPFYAQFIPILCIVKNGLPLMQRKTRTLTILPCLLVCEAKSREKVKGLINLQFIFIVSRCFNLLVLGGHFSLSFAVAQMHCQHWQRQKHQWQKPAML